MSAPVPYKNNYTFGRGIVAISGFIAGTETPDGNYRYVGNSPAINLNIAGSELNHFSSEGGINELDETILTQVTRTATLNLDDISGPNLAILMMGSTAIVNQDAVAVATTEIFKAVPENTALILGVTETNPVGHRNAVVASVKSGSVAGVEGKDFFTGNNIPGVFIPAGSNLIGLDLTVEYTVPALSYEQVLSGSTAFLGALRYTENNPAGINKNFFAPKVRITPNGDFALKGDTWQAMAFSVAILKPASGAALYINGEATAK